MLIPKPIPPLYCSLFLILLLTLTPSLSLTNILSVHFLFQVVCTNSPRSCQKTRSHWQLYIGIKTQQTIIRRWTRVGGGDVISTRYKCVKRIHEWVSAWETVEQNNERDKKLPSRRNRRRNGREQKGGGCMLSLYIWSRKESKRRRWKRRRAHEGEEKEEKVVLRAEWLRGRRDARCAVLHKSISLGCINTTQWGDRESPWRAS